VNIPVRDNLVEFDMSFFLWVGGWKRDSLCLFVSLIRKTKGIAHRFMNMQSPATQNKVSQEELGGESQRSYSYLLQKVLEFEEEHKELIKQAQNMIFVGNQVFFVNLTTVEKRMHGLPPTSQQFAVQRFLMRGSAKLRLSDITGNTRRCKRKTQEEPSSSYAQHMNDLQEGLSDVRKGLQQIREEEVKLIEEIRDNVLQLVDIVKKLDRSSKQ